MTKVKPCSPEWVYIQEGVRPEGMSDKVYHHFDKFLKAFEALGVKPCKPEGQVRGVVLHKGRPWSFSTGLYQTISVFSWSLTVIRGYPGSVPEKNMDGIIWWKTNEGKPYHISSSVSIEQPVDTDNLGARSYDGRISLPLSQFFVEDSKLTGYETGLPTTENHYTLAKRVVDRSNSYEEWMGPMHRNFQDFSA
jgi:hypothetical protein